MGLGGRPMQPPTRALGRKMPQGSEAPQVTAMRRRYTPLACSITAGAKGEDGHDCETCRGGPVGGFK